MAVKRENTEIRQQQIVDAARKLIFKYGSEHLTVKKIAAEVGFSEAAIYRHFKSRKEILSFLLEHMGRTLLGDLSQAREETPLTLAGIERAIQNHFSAIDLRKGVSFQVIADIISLGDKRLNRQALKTLTDYIAVIEELLTAGVHSGCIRPDLDINAAAKMLYGIAQGLANLCSLDNSSFTLTEQFASHWAIYREAIIPR